MLFLSDDNAPADGKDEQVKSCSKGENGMNKTILLVDDVQMFIEIQREFLQGSQVNIITAKNGLEALDVIKNRKIPDLVFLDLHMPDMDGAECCRVIKSDPLLPGVPVVMVTAMGKSDDAEYSFTAGCDDFLTKPLDRDLFLEAARRFIPSIDRRKKRLSIQLSGVLSNNEETLACTLHDISVGGAFVASNHEATPRKVLKLFFTMPDGTRIECHGRIAWINRSDANFPKGFGVQFALLPKKAKEAIAALIASNK
jgi:CheY-like chemotaxis protein